MKICLDKLLMKDKLILRQKFINMISIINHLFKLELKVIEILQVIIKLNNLKVNNFKRDKDITKEV